LTKHTAYNLNLQTKGGGGVHELVGETTPIPFQTKIYAHKFGAFPQVRVNIKNFEVTISSIPCMRLGMIWIEKGENMFLRMISYIIQWSYSMVIFIFNEVHIKTAT